MKTKLEPACEEGVAIARNDMPSAADLVHGYLRARRPEESCNTAGTVRLRGKLVGRTGAVVASASVVGVPIVESPVQ